MILPCSVRTLQLLDQFAGAAGTNDLLILQEQFAGAAGTNDLTLLQIRLQVLLAPMILPCSVRTLQLLEQFVGAAGTNDPTLQCQDP